MDPAHASREDVDDILRRKRKMREHKACYPCRQRKVKCDSQVPCKTCVGRNHPELCTFEPPEKRQDIGSTHGGLESGNGSVTISQDDWSRLWTQLSSMEKTMSDLQDDLRRVGRADTAASQSMRKQSPRAKEDEPQANGPKYVRAMELSEQSHLSGENVHLGGGSVPALVMALGKARDGRPAVQEVVGGSVLSLFGLDNESATYPFVSLWGGPQGASARVSELCRTLPGDAECLEFFRYYRNGAFVTYPAITEIDQFEHDIIRFLTHRNQSNGNDGVDTPTNEIYGMSMQWIGLLFAALASGVQFSNMQKKDRDLASQVYVSCSFECLRLINWLSNASVEVIQTLLVLGNVLSNGMNAGVAWALLGLTTRLAQSLGFHRASDLTSPTHQDVVRSKTWWAILWQDSMLSLSYDRAPSAAVVDCSFPPSQFPEEHGLTYPECMYRLCKIGLDTVRNRVANQTIQSRLGRCGGLRERIVNMQSQAAGHLRDIRKSTSIKDQSEYWALYLHASFMTSELCRPAISPSIAEFDKSKDLRRLCIEHLMHTVEAFLGLVKVEPVYQRSWGAVHRVLSAALLLGILGEGQRNPSTQQLLSDLIDFMSDMSVTSVDPSDLTAPISRSISALRKLNAPESRTPRQVEELMASAAKPQTQQNDPSNNLNVNDLASFTFDNASFYLPSPLSRLEDESSPYALMDSIIFGGQGGVEIPS